MQTVSRQPHEPHDKVAVAKLMCRESWPPPEDGGGAASAERKAGRPVQLEPNSPSQPARPGVQPRPGAQQGAPKGPGCLHRPHWQEGKQVKARLWLSGRVAALLVRLRAGGLSVSDTGCSEGLQPPGDVLTAWQLRQSFNERLCVNVRHYQSPQRGNSGLIRSFSVEIR